MDDLVQRSDRDVSNIKDRQPRVVNEEGLRQHWNSGCPDHVHTLLSTHYMALACDDIKHNRDVESLETASMRQDAVHFVNGNLTETNNQSLENVKLTHADQSSRSKSMLPSTPAP